MVYCPRCSHAYHDRPTTCACGAPFRPIAVQQRPRTSMNSRQKQRKVAHLLRKHGPICHLCKAKIDMELEALHPWAVTLDHIQPVAKGGSDHLSNLRLAHRTCNGDRRADPL